MTWTSYSDWAQKKLNASAPADELLKTASKYIDVKTAEFDTESSTTFSQAVTLREGYVGDHSTGTPMGYSFLPSGTTSDVYVYADTEPYTEAELAEREAKYKEKYDNERLTTEKQRLELEKSNITYWWMFTIVIVLLLGILLIYIYLHKRIAIHQKEEKLTRLALQLHDKELEVEKNESYIAELQSQFEQNNKKEELYVEQVEALKKLKKENERLSLEKNMLHEKIASYSISGHELSDVKTLSDRILLLEKREKELCSLLLTQAPFLRKLHLQPVYLNETELKDVCKIADNIFQKFTQRLSKEVSVLSEHEIILCSLIKLRFSITEISIFLNIAPASVSRSKLRIKNKICSVLGENLKEKSLDVWLWEY